MPYDLPYHRRRPDARNAVWYTPEPFGWGGMPFAPFVGGWPMDPLPYAAGDFARAYGPEPRRDPRQSRTYGRGGDRALREWARRYGRDFEQTIEPRPRRRPAPRGYDRY